MDVAKTAASPAATICVVGSLNLDLVSRVARLPRPGETIAAGDVQSIPGGKGANQAVAAARLGARVQMIGCVGDDEAAEFACTAGAIATARFGAQPSLPQREEVETLFAKGHSSHVR